MIPILKNKKLLALVILLLGILILLLILSLRGEETTDGILPVLKDESSYPEAASQNFKGVSNQTGILLVDSNPDGARVMLDTPEEEVSETEVPINITPFKVSRIPVGAHTISLFKEGYVLETQQFQIQPGKTLRLNIQLQPLEGTQKDKTWVAKLPLQSKYYFVEYNSEKNVIVATLTLSLEGQVEQEREIDILKDEILNKLTMRGVDLTKEKVEWVIK